MESKAGWVHGHWRCDHVDLAHALLLENLDELASHDIDAQLLVGACLKVGLLLGCPIHLHHHRFEGGVVLLLLRDRPSALPIESSARAPSSSLGALLPGPWLPRCSPHGPSSPCSKDWHELGAATLGFTGAGEDGGNECTCRFRLDPLFTTNKNQIIRLPCS
jgi:hypothetical protein